MAAITSNAVTGLWNDTGSWVGGVIPGSGDTVTLADGAIITVPFSYTATCGSSPADDTGTPAIQCASNSGTGRLVINGTFVWKGPVRVANAMWVVNAGATVTYDPSAAANPATALYTWRVARAASQANARLVLNGTPGLTVKDIVWNSVGGYQSGGIGQVAAENYLDGGRVEATGVAFSNQGAATTTGVFLYSRISTAVSTFLKDCTVDQCGMIQVFGTSGAATGIGAAATFYLRGTKITRPVNSAYTLQLYTGWARTTGVREISNCDIAGRISFFPNDSTATPINTGFTFRRCILRCRDLSTGSMNNVLELAGGGVEVWDEMLLALITASTTTVQDPGVRYGPGTYDRTYLYRQVTTNAIGANMHPIYIDNRQGDFTCDRHIFRMTVTDSNGDVLNWVNDPTTNRNVKVKRCIYPENAAGNVVGSLMLQQGAVVQDNAFWFFEHCTVACAIAGLTNLAQGLGAEAGATWPAGTVQEASGNIFWRRTSGVGTLANSVTTATVAAGAIVSARCNGTWNVTGSLYSGAPSGQFAGTPGVGDVSGNPQFVDFDRSILNFDQGYFGASAGAVWLPTTVYAVGDIVSSSTSGWFQGANYNWRCVAAHTASAADKPGSGQNWCAYWEPACLKTISDSLLAGTTYNGGTRSIVGELIEWERGGLAPQNLAYRAAAHDGGDIGAVPGVFPTDVNLTVTLAPATLSSSAAVLIAAASTVTLDPAALSATAAVAIAANLGVTLGAATLSATTVTGASNTANLTVTLEPATLSASAAVLVALSAAVTLDAATLTATVVSVPVSTMQPGGAFRRALPTWPRIWRYNPVLATESLSLVAAESDDRDYVFDLSPAPEIRGGLTLTSGTIVGGAGLTIADPVILDDEFDGIPAGQGLSVRISGGAAGTVYKLACRAVLSNGRTVVVPGRLAKVADYEA